MIQDLYMFYKLDKQKKDKIIELLSLGYDVGWKSHREKYLLPLCKKLNDDILTVDELLRFREAKSIIGNIRSLNDLDLCLMFWQISHKDKYWDIILIEAFNKNSVAALTIILHYK